MRTCLKIQSNCDFNIDDFVPSEEIPSLQHPQDFAFFEGFDLPELLRATAWPTSTLKADSSTSSPSGMSIARRAFPSRLELKRRAGSFRDAPVVRPNRSAHPLPVLDHVWVCFLDELAHSA